MRFPRSASGYSWVVLSLLLVALALAPFLSSLPRFPRAVDIVVLGHFEDDLGFSAQVKQGARAAVVRLAETNAPGPMIRVQTFDVRPFLSSTGAIHSPTAFEWSLNRKVAQLSAVALIDATHSATSTAMAPMVARLRLPVLVAVATDDRVLEAYQGVALRLLPNNTKQAATIQDALLKDIPAIIIHDTSSYASDIATRLREETPGSAPIAGVYMTQTADAVASLVRTLFSSTPSTPASPPPQIVFIGYNRDVPSLTSALRDSQHTPARLVLSDGCYYDFLQQDASALRCDVHLVFPVDPALLTGGSELAAGYTVFGHDAVHLVHGAIRAMGGVSAAAGNMLPGIQRFAEDSQLLTSSRLSLRYRFEAAENRAATFHLHRIGGGSNP